jgi:hypothetical protein
MHSEQTRAIAYSRRIATLIDGFRDRPYLPYDVMQFADLIEPLLNPNALEQSDVDPDTGRITFGDNVAVSTIVKAWAHKLHLMYFADSPRIDNRGREYWVRRRITKKGLPPGGIQLNEKWYITRGEGSTTYKMVRTLEPTPALFLRRDAQLTEGGAVEYSVNFIRQALNKFANDLPDVDDWVLSEQPYQVGIEQ